MKDYKPADLSHQTISLITQAQNFNIGNAVTFIYLGERATDTVFEALIVIITALSMEYLRRRR
jgi:multisubunit Na+/H+ antiporter MnhB subunit